MAFLFSRKSEPRDDTLSSKENGRPNVVKNNETGFKSLRARLHVYAKKLDPKDRDSSPGQMFSQPTSVAATLSPPTATPIADRHVQLKLKLSNSSPALRTNSRRSASNTSATQNKHSMQPSDSSDQPSSSRSRALGTKASSSSLATPATPSRKPTTDAVTTTLAQRLNELAVANSEGLLDDDEYRLLRQDLFERFSSTTTVPTEIAVVPLASPLNLKSRSTSRTNSATAPTDKRQSIDSRRMSISTSSNFYIEKQRTPSVHSRSSTTSGVASFFRRATGRFSSSHDTSDTSSLFSSASKRLNKKSSASSLATDRGDTVSISSRRTNLASPIEPNHPPPSIRSVRRLPTPPSSFPNRLPGVESRFAGATPEPDSPSEAGGGGPDTVATLRREIQNVEAERRRLMDAFNGLELTALSKRRRTALTGPGRDSVATLVPDSAARSIYSIGRSRKGSDADGDAASMHSATSAGTTPSMTSRRGGSVHRGTGGGAGGAGSSLKPHGYGHSSPLVQSTSASSRVGSLRRKDSGSSFGSAHTSSRLGIGSHSQSASVGMSHASTSGGSSTNLAVPPVPALPLGMSHGQLGSTPSLSRSTGHLPMSVVREDEAVLTVDLDDEREFSNEMEDLRRRREEVAGRYDSRLEYLRAKLKGAELHEKLMSK
ncbi:hypothetical protein R3P38DRAFT_3174493 [Favolaschia claudopus]|uniref:Uncharacterized protein n=1 Tax=Favolaschia claudopus TaxID=2862362 RepID=A0AAW0DA78_9AGAR